MNAKINPQISIVEVGVRELRAVTIYPLSMADQKKLVKILSTTVNRAADKAKKLTDAAMIEFIVSAITDNLQDILALILDPADKIAEEELTNVQLADIADTIYVANFEYAIKKFKALIQTVKATPQIMKKEEALTEPLPDSLDTPITD